MSNLGAFEELFEFVKNQEWLTIDGSKIKYESLSDKHLDNILKKANRDKGFASISSLLLAQLEKARRRKIIEDREKYKRREYRAFEQGEIYTNIAHAFQVIVNEDSEIYSPKFSGTVVEICKDNHAYQRGYHKSEWSKKDFILSTDKVL